MGSKHGVVFKINFFKRNIMATYRTNESCINSIAVNEEYVVIGGQDMMLHVWDLFCTKQQLTVHNTSAVSHVEISNDGIRIVCGSVCGSIGYIDKPEGNYINLMRAHTDDIIAMDYHVPRRNILTVSKD